MHCNTVSSKMATLHVLAWQPREFLENSFYCHLPFSWLQAERCKQRGEAEKARYYHKHCCVLHCVTVLFGVIFTAMFFLVFVYISLHTSY